MFGSPESTVTAKTAFSCLRFLLISATRHNTDNDVFDAELQQLGLPKEHSVALCRVFSEHSNDIRKYLSSQNLIVNELDKLSWTIPANTIDCGQLQFTVKNELVHGVPQKVVHNVNIQKGDINVLLNELLEVRKIMEKYEN